MRHWHMWLVNYTLGRVTLHLWASVRKPSYFPTAMKRIANELRRQKSSFSQDDY